MELKLAQINDLSKLKIMFEKIIEDMEHKNIQIWNKYYPYEMFRNDIEKRQLYILTNNDEIAAAFVLFEQEEPEKNLEWSNIQERALYMSRVGVNVNFLRQGIGSLVIEKAINISREKEVRYLRLLVVEENKPAINLYLKNGFRQVKGFNKEKINDKVVLTEYGFEIDIK